MTNQARPSPASRRALFLVDDVLFDEHRARGDHPERPERLAAARRAIARCEAGGVRFSAVGPRDARDDDLEPIHAGAYIEAFSALDGRQTALDADTYVAPRSVAAARRAAGGAMALVEALVDASGTGGPGPTTGVALLRPPGHHATRDRGMGFCLLNNVALAAAHALARGCRRVAIVDWDVHHGNGTQDIFWDDPRVLYLSLHQHPFYPGTGDVDEMGGGDARGHTVNVPLSAGATDAVYEAAFHEILSPVLDGFAPDLVLVSAGFDAHARDPLASMRLSEAAYASMTRSLSRAAAAHANGRIGVFLEGGYDLPALESSLAATLLALVPPESTEDADPVAADPARRVEAPVGASHRDELTRARKAAAETWRGL